MVLTLKIDIALTYYNIFKWFFPYSQRQNYEIIETTIKLIYVRLQWSKTTQQTFVGLQDVFNTSSRHVLNFSSSKTSSRRLGGVLKTSCKYILKTSWRRLEDISQGALKTSWKTKNCYVEDVLKTCLEDVLETNKMFTGICI